MQCPELYPPSPQMTPLTSTGGIRPRLSAPVSSAYILNSSSENSDTEESPPAYPGFTPIELRKLGQQIQQLASEAQNTNSQTLSSTVDADDHMTESTSSISATIHENHSQLGNQPIPGTCQESNSHSSETMENEMQSQFCENEEEAGEQSRDISFNQDQCTCDIIDHNGRERVNTNSSIVGTVV